MPIERVAIRRVACPAMKAEGHALGYPYDTELVNINGVEIHFWLRGDPPSPALLDKLERMARRNRDVVRMTFSDGEPTGFWANQDLK